MVDMQSSFPDMITVIAGTLLNFSGHNTCDIRCIDAKNKIHIERGAITTSVQCFSGC